MRHTSAVLDGRQACMRRFVFGFACALFLIPLLLAHRVVSRQVGAAPSASPGSLDLTAVKICDALSRLFGARAETIWPGYNLAVRPLVLYRQGKWAIVFNGKHEGEGFGAMPSTWPRLKLDLRFHPNQYADLAGQLVFDVKADGVKTVAVPIDGASAQPAKSRMLRLFALVVHEAFHQYQREVFADSDSLSEERYPIQDRDNTALAFLEMQLLRRAVEASGAGRAEEVEDCLKRFVAVRDARWKRNNYMAAFERHEEIVEGTAKYVEVKSLSLLKGIEYDPVLESMGASLSDDFREAGVPGYLLRDFDSRTTNGSVFPSDMPRNRIYPVGAALGVALDTFGSDWKKEIAANAQSISFLEVLKRRLRVEDSILKALLEGVKREYGYQDAWNAADGLIRVHEKAFQDALATFERQAGYRVRIKASSQGVTRSRSSSVTRLIVDEGRRSLCKQYNVYTLSGRGFTLNLHDVAVLEENDWDIRTRTVTFYAPNIDALGLNGTQADVSQPATTAFTSVALNASKADFKAASPGSVRIGPAAIEIDLTGSTGSNQ